MKIAVPFEGVDEQRVRQAAATYRAPASVIIRALVNHALTNPDPVIDQVLADAAEAERARRRAAGRLGMHSRWGVPTEQPEDAK